MFQSKTGLWIAGACAAVVLVSIGYGMGRRASAQLLDATASLAPAGSPLPAIQIEPIQPQQELAAISTTAPAALEGLALAPAAGSAPAGPVEESARIREIQLALRAAGFDPGPADGKMGQRTRTAIRDFQTAQGLDPDGKVGPRTWSRLEPFLKKQASSSD